MRLKLLKVIPNPVDGWKGKRLVVMLDEDNGVKIIVTTGLDGRLEMYPKSFDIVGDADRLQTFLYTIDWSKHD